MSKTEQNRLEIIYKQSRLKPPYDKWPFIRRFWVFQNERVPIAALFVVGLALTAAVAKISGNFNWTLVMIAASMSTLYFLQIRLADEPKDFEHDNKYHPKRPVQRGLITLKELAVTKNLGITAFMVLACLTGSLLVVALAVLQQAYSYLTRKEFFARDWLRQHFFIYQYSHYAQLLILGWLSITILQIQPLHEQLIYFGYFLAMIAPVESSRTIGGSDEKQADDRYSYKLGTGVALASFLVVTVLMVGYTVFLLQHTGGSLNPILLVPGLIVIALAAIRYEHNPITKNAEVLNFSSLIIYLCAAGTLLIS